MLAVFVRRGERTGQFINLLIGTFCIYILLAVIIDCDSDRVNLNQYILKLPSPPATLVSLWHLIAGQLEEELQKSAADCICYLKNVLDMLVIIVIVWNGS